MLSMASSLCAGMEVSTIETIGLQERLAATTNQGLDPGTRRTQVIVSWGGLILSFLLNIYFKTLDAGDARLAAERDVRGRGISDIKEIA